MCTVSNLLVNMHHSALLHTLTLFKQTLGTQDPWNSSKQDYKPVSEILLSQAHQNQSSRHTQNKWVTLHPSWSGCYSLRVLAPLKLNVCDHV